MQATEHEIEDLRPQVENLKTAIREVSHDISNPLGVLRLVAYFLEVTNPDPQKKVQYIRLVTESLDKIEAQLKRLKTIRDDPKRKIGEIPYRGELEASEETQVVES